MARQNKIWICGLVLLLFFAMSIPVYAQETDGEETQPTGMPGQSEQVVPEEGAAPSEPEVQVEQPPEEPSAQPDTITIELIDADGGTAAVSDGVAVWTGTVSVQQLPAKEQTGPQTTAIPRTSHDIPCYYQTNYPETRYGSGTIATSGCSITCLAMVATYMTDHVYTPVELADYFGGRAFSNMARLETGSDMLQLAYRKAGNWHDSLQALKDGKVVIALMEEESVFTSSQHFIVLTGVTEDGKITVNDPYKPNYDRWELQNGFSGGFSEADILCGYSGGWIYDKSAMPAEPFVYVEEKPIRQHRYPEFNLSYEDMELLARVVWVEARGESPEGQQAVAEVVFNRMASASFPSTLRGVIYGERNCPSP